MTLSAAPETVLDRHSYFATRRRGLSYRNLADGGKAFFGYMGGKRVPLGLPPKASQTVAEAAYDVLRGDVRTGKRKVTSGAPRFTEACETWFAEQYQLRPWTRQCYEAARDTVLIPRFGNKRLAEIDADAIAALAKGLHTQGLHCIDPKRPVRPLSPSAVLNYLKPLRGIMALAVRRGWVSANPFSVLLKGDLPRQGASKKVYEWEPREIEALLDAATVVAKQPDSRYNYSPLLKTAIETGLRLGELVGLQWGDIDTTERVLYVRRQIGKTGQVAPPRRTQASGACR